MLSGMVFNRTQPQMGGEVGDGGWPVIAVLFHREKCGNCCFLPSQILTLQGVFLSPLFVLRESKTRDLEGGMLRTTHFSLLPYFY